MFHRNIQTPRRKLEKTTRSGVFGVWIADETLSPQTKQKLREVKSLKSMLIKAAYPNRLHGCIFLRFNLMNY